MDNLFNLKSRKNWGLNFSKEQKFRNQQVKFIQLRTNIKYFLIKRDHWSRLKLLWQITF